MGNWQPKAYRTMPPSSSCLSWMEMGKGVQVRQAAKSRDFRQLRGACPSYPWPLPGVTLLRAKPLGLVSHTLGLGQA